MNKELLIKESLDFIKTETPKIIQEYLNWCFWSDIVFIGLSFIILLVGIFSAKTFIKIESSYEITTSEKNFVLAVAGSVFGLLGGTIGFLVNTYDLILLQTAPRVYLLKTIEKLLK